MRITAFSDDKRILDTSLEQLKLINPKISQEDNKVGSFTFTIYPDHPYYNFIEKMKSIIEVYEEGISEPLFRGRVYDEKTGFYNEKQVSCEGELAFLLDSIQRPYAFPDKEKGQSGTPAELFTQYINNHNAQVDEARQFKVGNITVTDPNDYIVRSNSDYVSTWDELNAKLIDHLGGHLWVRHEADGNYIDYLADFNVLSNQTIDFGKNLLDLQKRIKAESFATALIPLGAKLKDEQGNETSERLTIKAVNNNVDYVYNAEAVAKYGYIFTTNTWDDVTVASNLKSKGQERIDDMAQFTASIEVSAADLNGATIDGEVADVNSFRIGRYVKVNTKPHSIQNQNFIVSKLSRELLKPENTKLTLGTTYKTLTERQLSQVEQLNQYVQTVSEQVKKSGKGIKEIVEYYLVSASTSGVTHDTSGWTTDIPIMTTANKYLWNYEKITYTDNSVDKQTPKVIGVYGDSGKNGSNGENGKDGVDGKGIKSIVNYYLATASLSGVTTETSGWTTTVQNVTSSKKYLWNYEVVTYTSGNPTITTPCIIGAYGDTGDKGAKGDTGATGKGIKSTSITYQASTSGTTVPGGTWSSTIPAVSTGQYLWTKTVITYTDNTSSTAYSVGRMGTNGVNGKDVAIQSATEPTDKSYMWLDTSTEPPILKRWNGTAWVVVNDMSDTITLLEQRFTADISTSEKSIKQTMTESYYTKDATDKLVNSVSSSLEHTANGFEMQFNNITKNLDDVSNNADTRFQEISKYIRFVDGNIVLGEAGSELVLKIANDRISFLQNNTEVAYFSNRKLYVTDGEYTNSLQLGKFAFIPRTNGNLSFKKIVD